MSWEAWVAIYAAAVATASLGWQVISWRLQRRHDVSVSTRSDENEGLSIKVTNRSEFKIRVEEVTWAFLEEEHVRLIPLDKPEELWIDSMDSRPWRVSLDELERHGALGAPCGAWVRLSTGEVVHNLNMLYDLARMQAHVNSQRKVITDNASRFSLTGTSRKGRFSRFLGR